MELARTARRFLAARVPCVQAVTSRASIYYKDEAELLDAAEDTDKVYLEEILPAKMYYNLKEIESFGFWRNIGTMFMTVFAVLGKEYKGDYEKKEDVAK